MEGTELAKAYVQIIPSARGIKGQLEEQMGGDTDSAGLSLGKRLGSAIKRAIAVAGIGIAIKEAVSAISDVAGYGDNIDKMSQKMGMTANAYQEWDAVMQHCGTSIESMQASMKTLSTAAESGNEAFEKIGISQEKLASMSQEELFSETIKGLQNVESDTERTYLAGKLLGRGATELGALLNTSAEDTQKMKDRVHELGGVLSNEAVKSAAAYEDSLQDMKTAFSGIKNNIEAEFLPAVTSVMDGITEVFMGNESGLGMIKKGIGDFANNILSEIPKLLERGIDIASILIQGIITGMQEGLPMLFVFAEQMITEMQTAIQLQLPQLLQDGVATITNFVNGILMNIPQLIMTAGTLVSEFIAGIAPMLPMILQTGTDLLLNLANGIISNLPQIAASAASAVATITTTIGQNLPQILQSGIEIIGKLAAGLVRAIPTLVGKIPEIITSIRSTFEGTDWGSIGINIIQGIANGLSSAAGQLWDAVKDVLGGFKDNVLAFFGIKSPSRWGKYVGEMIDVGIAGGVTGNLGIISDAAREVKKSAAIPFGSEMTYSVSGKLNGARTESNVLEKLDRLIALLEVLAYSKGNETTKGTLSQREVIRILRDWGVVIE